MLMVSPQAQRLLLAAALKAELNVSVVEKVKEEEGIFDLNSFAKHYSLSEITISSVLKLSALSTSLTPLCTHLY